MSEARARAVVLARPGEASAKLQDAVRGAGAELLGAFDPTATTAEAVAALSPQAVLVALEPALEEALDAFEPLLARPDVTVIFDEAELAVQRTGWDAQRWIRHLAAKLHRHHDVLPPGRATAAAAPAAAAPAQAEPGSEPAPGPARVGTGDVVEAPIPELPAPDDLEIVDAAAEGLAVEALALDAEGAAAAWPLDEIAPGGVRLDDVALPDSSDGDAAAGADGGLAELLQAGASFDDLVHAAGDDGLRLPEDAREFLDPVEARWDGDDPAAPTGVRAGHGDADEAAAADAPHAPGIAGLTLAGPDAGPLGTAPAAADARLADLERRIGALSLADVDSYGFGALQGAVLIEAGLGGPDPVRRLLAAMPDDFGRPLLVRLRLGGGRYDRLVAQMARATTLPVCLAEPGAVAERGTVYFLPPELGLEQERAQLRFVAEAGAETRLPRALPAADSAVVFLSGADAGLVEAAAGADWAGALLVAQSPDGCYDAAAPAALVERGGIAAAPADIAALLVRRWTPGADATEIELEAAADE
ncbi:chemotaxis protein CheB [Luteimonas huabeiensis]|uniref:chemotaxis protein CheB n=1 Tax=Luteimonas huabeiensis TaxID=1244513 RepID=UPI001268A810|nr:chemotaxis protein CheB [Luteimonas huabeiensis]